jgi:hypothetical protein
VNCATTVPSNGGIVDILWVNGVPGATAVVGANQNNTTSAGTGDGKLLRTSSDVTASQTVGWTATANFGDNWNYTCLPITGSGAATSTPRMSLMGVGHLWW